LRAYREMKAPTDGALFDVPEDLAPGEIRAEVLRRPCDSADSGSYRAGLFGFPGLQSIEKQGFRKRIFGRERVDLSVRERIRQERRSPSPQSNGRTRSDCSEPVSRASASIF